MTACNHVGQDGMNGKRMVGFFEEIAAARIVNPQRVFRQKEKLKIAIV